jgi:hypothetical protein
LADYQNNDNCSWLIDPYGAGHINLTFDNFSTLDAGDILTIYNGPNASSPVLHTYTGIDTGSALPALISSTASSVFLTFVTNGSGTSSGWKISYTTTYPVFCSGTKSLTAAADTFSNGSAPYNYDNSTNCKWLINPSPAASSVTLHFLAFNTEPTNDVVKVTDNAGTVLASYSGTSLPADVTSNTGQMLIIFTSNSSITAPGWTACYSSAIAGVEEYNSIKDLSVFPNPAKDKLHVSFNVKGSDQATLNIYSLTGQVVYTQDVNCINGSFSKDIDISNFAKGIYNLRILTSKESVNKKIIVE